MEVLIQQDLHNVLNHSMQDITSRFAGIQLSEQDVVLSDDICTVHTIFEGNHQAALLLHADTALMTRLTQNILRRETVTQQDIADAATEYFNIVCGRIVAGLFQSNHISSRFQIPRFHTGRYLPENGTSCRCVLNYRGGRNQSIRLICMGLLSKN